MANFIWTKGGEFINLDHVTSAFENNAGFIAMTMVDGRVPYVANRDDFYSLLGTVVPACESDVAIIPIDGDGSDDYPISFYRMKVVAWRITAESELPVPVLAAEHPSVLSNANNLVGLIRPDGGVSIPEDADFGTVSEYEEYVVSRLTRIRAMKEGK